MDGNGNNKIEGRLSALETNSERIHENVINLTNRLNESVNTVGRKTENSIGSLRSELSDVISSLRAEISQVSREANESKKTNWPLLVGIVGSLGGFGGAILTPIYGSINELRETIKTHSDELEERAFFFGEIHSQIPSLTTRIEQLSAEITNHRSDGHPARVEQKIDHNTNSIVRLQNLSDDYNSRFMSLNAAQLERIKSLERDAYGDPVGDD